MTTFMKTPTVKDISHEFNIRRRWINKKLHCELKYVRLEMAQKAFFRQSLNKLVLNVIPLLII